MRRADNYMQNIQVKGKTYDGFTVHAKTYNLPIYLPDATRGVVKSLDSKDLKDARIEGVVVNTYHISKQPEMGPIKKFMNFSGLVTSDSGGWQVFSLIHRSNGNGTIADEGVTFKIDSKKSVFTPELSIQTQFKIDSDIMICLDDFTAPDATESRVKESVDRTVLWAKRSKKEYERLLKKHKIKNVDRPLLLAVIQGGWSRDLRKECAEKLVKIGFDAYGFGGYVVNGTEGMDMEISKYIANLIPNDKLKFALGSGKPWEIVQLAKMGWDIFDCTLPTRDARHQRLYVFNKEPNSMAILEQKDTFGHIDIGKAIYQNDQTPIDPFCDCHSCKNYSKSYLRHLFKIKDTTALRLATIHNIRHYTRIVELIRKLG